MQRFLDLADVWCVLVGRCRTLVLKARNRPVGGFQVGLVRGALLRQELNLEPQLSDSIGGIRWIASDRFLVRGDFTVMLYRLTTPAGYFNADRGFTGVGEKEWVNAPTFSLGIAYHF